MKLMLNLIIIVINLLALHRLIHFYAQIPLILWQDDIGGLNVKMQKMFGYNPISVEDSILIMQNKQMKEWNIRRKVSQEEVHLYVSTNI